MQLEISSEGLICIKEYGKSYKFVISRTNSFFSIRNGQNQGKRPFGNLGMGISALASSSESACEYNYSLFVKHVIFNKGVTYRLEAFDFVRQCFAKISRRKFLDNLKRATAQDSCRKSSVVKSFLIKLPGWTLDLQLQWEKPSTKYVYLWIYWNFQSFYRKVLHELSFFDKIQGYVLQGWSFIKMLVHYRLFSQKKYFSIFF